MAKRGMSQHVAKLDVHEGRKQEHARLLPLPAGWEADRDLLMDEYVNDMGGCDNCSMAERSLIRRIATMSVELNRLEVRFAQQEEPAPNYLALYCTLANSMRRLMESVGLQRRAVDITPDLGTYLKAKAIEHEE
jgi:hypothetical protein